MIAVVVEDNSVNMCVLVMEIISNTWPTKLQNMTAVHCVVFTARVQISERFVFGSACLSARPALCIYAGGSRSAAFCVFASRLVRRRARA